MDFGFPLFFFQSYRRPSANGAAVLEIISDVFASDENLLQPGRAQINVVLRDRARVIGPPFLDDEYHDLSTGHEETYFEDLEALEAPENTAMWADFMNLLEEKAPRLSSELSEFFEEMIETDLREAAKLAASTVQRSMVITVDIEVITNMSFEQYQQEHHGDLSPAAEMMDEIALLDWLEAIVEEEAGWLQGRMIGLSEAAINQNVIVKPNDKGAEETCTVCLENIESGAAAGWLSCGHLFHHDCIVQWLKSSRVCPNCRLHLPEIEE